MLDNQQLFSSTCCPAGRVGEALQIVLEGSAWVKQNIQLMTMASRVRTYKTTALYTQCRTYT